jgi:hypothetical protein
MYVHTEADIEAQRKGRNVHAIRLTVPKCTKRAMQTAMLDATTTTYTHAAERGTTWCFLLSCCLPHHTPQSLLRGCAQCAKNMIKFDCAHARKAAGK